MSRSTTASPINIAAHNPADAQTAARAAPDSPAITSTPVAQHTCLDAIAPRGRALAELRRAVEENSTVELQACVAVRRPSRRLGGVR
ncbi:hypothetical protein [Streptomyces sp. NPDC001020]